jgi:hypothetical protein
LAELVVTIGILALTLSGIMVAFVGAAALNEDSEMLSRALDTGMAQLETTRLAAINNFGAVVPGTTLFTIPGPAAAPNAYAATSRGVLTVTAAPAGSFYYVITAKVCWQGRSGRNMGEDRNLNGVLDLGAPSEDTNGDNLLTCPVDLVTTVARRN